MEFIRLMPPRTLNAAMGVADGTIHPSLPIHIRGSHLNLGVRMTREFPSVMRTSIERRIARSPELQRRVRLAGA